MNYDCRSLAVTVILIMETMAMIRDVYSTSEIVSTSVPVIDL